MTPNQIRMMEPMKCIQSACASNTVCASAFPTHASQIRARNENAPRRESWGVDVQMFRASWKPPEGLGPHSLALLPAQSNWRPSAARKIASGSVAVRHESRNGAIALPRTYRESAGSERPFTAYSAGDRPSKTNRHIVVKRLGGRLIHETDTWRIANKTRSAGCLEGRRVGGSGVLP
jgi:hypothetical protein